MTNPAPSVAPAARVQAILSLAQQGRPYDRAELRAAGAELTQALVSRLTVVRICKGKAEHSENIGPRPGYASGYYLAPQPLKATNSHDAELELIEKFGAELRIFWRHEDAFDTTWGDVYAAEAAS